MKPFTKLATIACIALAGSAFSQTSLAQDTTGGSSGGATTLRDWCKQGHMPMCAQTKSDRQAAKTACQGQQSGSQSDDACQQARAKLKSDMESMHQAGAPAPHRGRRGGGGTSGASDSGDE